MQGTWNHERAHYRCRYPSEYAIANHLDHPPSVYLREDQLTGHLDTWRRQYRTIRACRSHSSLLRSIRPRQIESAVALDRKDSPAMLSDAAISA